MHTPPKGVDSEEERERETETRERHNYREAKTTTIIHVPYGGVI